MTPKDGLPVRSEAVEAAAKAICEAGRTEQQPTWDEVVSNAAYSPAVFIALATAGLEAGMEAEGFEVEERMIPLSAADIARMAPPRTEKRLSSPWRPT